MKIVDIWTLADKYQNADLIHFHSIKYTIRILWPELARELDNLAKQQEEDKN